MLAAVSPPGAGHAERETYGDDCLVWPQERTALGRASEKRWRHFAIGVLGLPPKPVLRGASREPLWPDGLVGSLTHCDGYAAAVVAPQELVITVGVDAEPHEPLPDGVLARIARPEEREWIARQHDACCYDRLLF